MRILIATMTCGQGHNSIANSLREGFGNGDEVKIVNIYGHLGKKDSYGKSYLFCVKYIPRAFTFFWDRIRRRNPDKRYRGGDSLRSVKKAADEMERIVNEFKPDAVICTHVYASNVFCWLKINNRFHSKLYTVFFDYVACPYWEESVLCDGVFTPHTLTHEELLSRGFREEQLFPFGFPVNPKFDKEISESDARKMLGIDENAYVVLSVNGGAGVGNVKGFVKQILRARTEGVRPLCVLVVCGKNKKVFGRLKKLLQKRHVDHVKVFSFVDNIDVMLSAADLFFCRGGGGAVSEALVKHVPFVVRERAIAQEKRNAEIFTKLGVCKTMKRASDAKRIIESAYHGEIEFKLDLLRTLQQTGSVSKIVRFIHEHAVEAGGNID